MRCLGAIQGQKAPYGPTKDRLCAKHHAGVGLGGFSCFNLIEKSTIWNNFSRPFLEFRQHFDAN